MAQEEAAKEGRLARALPFLLAAAALLLLALPVLDPAMQLYDRDTARCEAPFKWEIWRRFAQHQLPLWVTWTEAGTSLLGQMTPALFHPSTLLYLALPYELAFKLQHLVALPLAAGGLYLLSRRLGAGRRSALSGGLIYAGSGWLVSMMGSNLHYALGAAAIPWALHGLLRFFDSRRAGWLLWAGWALSWPLVAGEPQSAIVAGLFGGALALAGRTLRENSRRLGMTALWALCAFALAAPAALPALARLRGTATAPASQSGRAGRAIYALPAWRLFGLAIPYAFDETLEKTPPGTLTPYAELSRGPMQTPFSQGIALGLPALLLALFAPRRQRRWLLGGALVCLGASLGPLLPIDGLLVELVPPLGLLRYPEKWLAPATLLLALAAALGASATLEEAARPEGDEARKLALGAAGSAFSCGAAWLLLGLLASPARNFIAARMADRAQPAAALFLAALRSGLLLEGALLFALALIAWMRVRSPQARARSLAPLCAEGLFACSMLATAPGLIYTMPLADLRAMPPLADRLRELAPGPLRIESFATHNHAFGDADSRAAIALWSAHALFTQYNARTGIENVAAYSSLSDGDYLEAFNRAPEAMRTLFDVQFVLEEPGTARRASPDLSGWQPTPLGLVLKQRPAEPRAFLAPCIDFLERDETYARLASPGFDVHRTALLRPAEAPRISLPACERETAAAGRLPAGSSSAAARGVALNRSSPEEIDAAFDAPAPALLVVAEHFDPGWSATLDGAPAAVVQVDRAALGVVAPKGPHRLVLRFFPVGLRAGLALALAAALGLIALELWQRRRGARPPRRGRSAP